MAVDIVNFVPKYINQTEASVARYVVTAERWNELWNLTIAQGDWNSEAITLICDELKLLVRKTEFDAHNHDSRYYTKDLLNNGQLNNLYYTETELNAGQLDSRYYTETEVDAIKDNLAGAGRTVETIKGAYSQLATHQGSSDHDGRYFTENELSNGALDTRYFTESELTSGALDSRYYTETEVDGIKNNLAGTGRVSETIKGAYDYTDTHKSSGDHDSRYYTETELNNGQLDSRYYTETELNNGQLDTRYYTETEMNNGQMDTRYFTETELGSVSDNNSGADKIGATAIGSSPTTVQGILEWLKSQLDLATAGAIPDDSISNAKLATDIKIGSITGLTTTTKSSIVAAINELVTNVGSLPGTLATAVADLTTAINAGDYENSLELMKAIFTVESQVAAGKNDLSQIAVDVFGDSTGISTAESAYYLYDASAKSFKNALDTRTSAQKTVTANGDAKLLTESPTGAAKTLTANGNARIKTSYDVTGKTVTANGNARIRTSSVGKTITVTGNAQIDTAQYAVGTSSLLLDGTGDYITAPHSSDFDISTGDFTIRCKVRLGTTGVAKFIAGKRTSDSATRVFDMGIDASNHFFCIVYHNSGSTAITAVGTYTTGTWYDLALVRNGNTVKFYIDGVAESTTIDLTGKIVNITTTPLTIGRGGDDTSTGQFNGWIDEFEFAKTARYTGNFTPSNTALTADQYTSLLLHFEGADASTTITDDSGKGTFGQTVTASGNAQIDTAQYKYGVSSCLFDGTGDLLTIADNDDWFFGTGAFTIRFFVRFAVLPTNGNQMNFCSQYQDATNYWTMDVENNAGTYTLRFLVVTGGSNTISIQKNLGSAPSTGTWYHVELDKSGNDYYWFWDGTQVSTTATDVDTIPNNTGSLRIGSINSLSYMNGWIDEFEISKGIARHTANFTAPTEQLVADEYTKLLLHFDGIDASTTFVDYSGARVAPKIGSGMGYFDNSGDYLSIAHDATLSVPTGNFTIECWVYGQLTTSKNLIGKATGGAAGSYSYLLFVDSGDNVNFQFYDGAEKSVNAARTTYLNANAWNHIAVVRNGNTVTLYINGTSRGTPITNAGTITDNSGWATMIGGLSYTASYSINTYMDEVRISKGIARYTGAFTPDTTQFTTDANTSLLLHFDGTQDSTTFIDSTGGTITPKTGTGMGYFDGTGDYIDTPDHVDFSTGSGDYTIQCWILRQSLGAIQRICGQADSAGNNGTICNVIGFDASNHVVATFYVGATPYTATSTGTIADTTTWHHIAVVRNGNTVTIYIDGVADGTVNVTGITVDNSAYKFAIGRNGEIASYYYNGFVDEFEFAKGIARYTGNFTPSASAITPDGYTKLLLHMDGTNDSTTFTDTVAAGDPNFSLKLGTAVGYFDGAGDYLSVPDSDDWNLGTGDFTLRTFIKFLALPVAWEFVTLAGQFVDANNYWKWGIRINGSSTQLMFEARSSGSTLVSYVETISTPALNTWYHYETTRYGNVFKHFVDGTAIGSGYTNIYGVAQLSAPLTIGYQATDTYVGAYLNGYLDELEIAKGVARHTAGFTPPATALLPDLFTVLLLHMDGSNNSTTFTDDVTATSNPVPMTLVSNALTASASPSKAFLTTKETLNGGTITYYISRDNGTTWTTVSKDTLTSIAAQPAGTSIKIKAVTSGSPSQQMHLNAWAFGYKV